MSRGYFDIKILLLSIVFLLPGISYSKPNEEVKAFNLKITEQLAYSTVKIDVLFSDGNMSSGSGFFFKFQDTNNQYIPLIITNKHLVKNSNKGTIYVTLADSYGNPQQQSFEEIVIDDFEKHWIFHPNKNIDLAVMPFGPIQHKLSEAGTHLFYIPIDKNLIPSENDLSELGAVENILMVGYPIGLWDEINNYPIFRQGITATHPAKDYNGKSEFLVDIACFPGSSGSPVFLYDLGVYQKRDGTKVLGESRLMFLGVLYAGYQYSPSGEIKVLEIPTRRDIIYKQYMPINLGNVIKSKEILEFEKIIKSFIKDRN